MDILYTGGVDGFCIVSSDSDFTRLATRLREAGKKVFGIGQKKTPFPFIASCNKFIYLEILQQEIKEESPVKESNSGTTTKKTVKLPPHISLINKELIQLIVSSINDIAEDDGWVFLGTLGSLILKKQPDFDPRNYGFKKLVDIIKRIPSVQIDERQTGKNNISHFYVRIK
jgi:uncharacterized LabA/DUF88 family protein